MDIRDALVLDAFAGAGSLGFEAASRGAKQVVCIEKDKQAAAQLKSNCQALDANAQIQVLQGDFFAKCRSLTEPFDLIFIDPPFHKGLVPQVFQALIDNTLLDSGSLIYLEQESNNQFDLMSSEWGSQFELVKGKNAGQVSAQLYRYLS